MTKQQKIDNVLKKYDVCNDDIAIKIFNEVFEYALSIVGKCGNCKHYKINKRICNDCDYANFMWTYNEKEGAQ